MKPIFMKPIFRVLVVLTCVAIPFALVTLLQAQAGAKSSSVVKVTAKLEHGTAGKDVVVVKFDVQKPWHIYANPVGNEEFASNATLIKVLAKVPPKVHVDYPAGKDYAHMGEKFKIYDGSFEIRATVEREAGATGPMEAVVRISACDENSCLLPDVIKISLP
jgi:uncharacterized protein